MTIEEILKNEHIELINDIGQDRVFHDVYIGDLLSCVMANGKDESLWITVQRHINVIAVAELVGFQAIVFVESAIPDQQTIEKANELSIPLLKTSLTAFELSKYLILEGM